MKKPMDRLQRTWIETVHISPSLLLVLVSLEASALFWIRGEADFHAPLIFGLGLMLFWRMRRGVLSLLLYWGGVISLSALLLERSGAHPVLDQHVWVHVETSPALIACALSLPMIALGKRNAHPKSTPEPLDSPESLDSLERSETES